MCCLLKIFFLWFDSCLSELLFEVCQREFAVSGLALAKLHHFIKGIFL
jgi:hypothetical protein